MSDLPKGGQIAFSERAARVRVSLRNMKPREQERLLAKLPGKRASVLRLRFGLITGVPRDMRDVGRALNISGERVRQLEALACETLERVDMVGVGVH